MRGLVGGSARLAWRLVRVGLVGAVLGGLAVALLVVGVRAWTAWGGDALRPWHTVVPPELGVAALDAADWAGFLAAEERAFAVVREQVSARLAPEDRGAANRYDPASPLNPAGFAVDWNRSFVLRPTGPPRGVAVLLHGMTDAPFSARHLARIYADAGFLAVVPRMPGHGTVPAGLSRAGWQDWAAATRLAVRAARAEVPQGPLHLVGYSNGGALALLHAVEAVGRPALHRPDRLVLLSPMVGVTAFARFAGLAGLPAWLPAFAEAAWLSIIPEFIPFKYNSFPVNAARQSHLLTAEVQAGLRRLVAEGRIGALPPVLTFQSVVDATVSARAVVTSLHALLPANGGELVLFDLNRDAALGPLVAPAAAEAAARLLPPAPRPFRVTLVTNAATGGPAVEARMTEAGATAETIQPLGLAWPREVFSLSHVALAFPLEDGLYGLRPDPADRQGVPLGAVAPRGETGVLVGGLEGLQRMSSNPFFPWMAARIAATLGEGGR